MNERTEKHAGFKIVGVEESGDLIFEEDGKRYVTGERLGADGALGGLDNFSVAALRPEEKELLQAEFAKRGWPFPGGK